MFQKISESLIYRDPEFYSSFPGIANLGDGELFIVFRRAPCYSGLPGVSPDWVAHLDRNSKLMYMRSHDNGKTWDIDHQLAIIDHWDIGYPSTVELNDGSLLTIFYAHPDNNGRQLDYRRRFQQRYPRRAPRSFPRGSFSHGPKPFSRGSGPCLPPTVPDAP